MFASASLKVLMRTVIMLVQECSIDQKAKKLEVYLVKPVCN